MVDATAAEINPKKVIPCARAARRIRCKINETVAFLAVPRAF
jgi:hypothetical protein